MLIRVVEPALQDGKLQQLDSSVEVKFAHAVGLVDFDGLDNNVQPLGDFLVAVSLRTQAQDAQFALGHRRRSSLTLMQTRGQKGCRQMPRKCRVDVLPAARSGTNGVQQLAVGTLFQDVRRDAGTQQLLQISLIGMAGQDDHLQRRPALAQRTGSERPLVPGIDKSMMTRSTSSRWAAADGIVAIAGLADHRHVRLMVDQQPQALSNRRVIFDQHNAQGSFTGFLLSTSSLGFIRGEDQLCLQMNG